MSRELLKRAYEFITPFVTSEHSPVGESLAIEIHTYLAQPEPEPVAMVNGSFGGFTTVMPLVSYLIPVNTPLYTSPPDQSARIADLETQIVKLTAERDALKAKIDDGVEI